MKKMIKHLSVLVVLIMLCGMHAFATEEEQKTASIETDLETDMRPFIAFGEDLTQQQKQEVIQIFGLSEEELANAVTVTVSNEEEHQYLGNYVDASIIGTKSLSSVLVRRAPSGHGVVVTTKNITYCTTGMYRNALLTAGVEDAQILVAGPSPISGTAGLIGAIRAYEKMSGKVVSEQTLDTALNELVATGEIASITNSADDEKVEELIAYIKGKLAAGELESDEEIRNAIIEGESKFGIDLSEEDILKIINLMNKIEKLGIDPEILLSQAKDLYDKFGNKILTESEDVLKEVAGNVFKNAVDNFVERVRSSISNFFGNLFN